MRNETMSVMRTENKYIVSKLASSELEQIFDRLLSRDEHAKMGAYMVRSLYFDTINNADYLTKMAGTEIRKKIRIRVYSNDSEQCKLEVKQKNGDLQRKVSLWITKSDAVELCRLNYSVLTKYFSVSSDAMYIYSLLVSGVYKPVALIEYDRIAYTYPLYNTRITLDMNLRSSESNIDLFSENPVYVPLMMETDVLEIKYNEKLVRFIADVLRKYKLSRCSVSKYCAGRKVFCDFNF